MKKFPLMLLFVACSLQLLAVDFSGTWKLNRSASQLNAQFTMAPNEVIISQKENEFVIERHSSFQDRQITIKDTFTLDGKECINKGFMNSEKKSVATWSADKNVLKVVTKFSIQDQEMTITETYQMDGGKLKVESAGSSSFGDGKEVYLFEK
ncbi:MAG: hypothetical protein LWW85_06285 [Marinilabiliales bacterium]|nr:hypothetical protein [Marinilabiliales bacterium]